MLAVLFSALFLAAGCTKSGTDASAPSSGDAIPVTSDARCTSERPPAEPGFVVVTLYYTCEDDPLPATPRPVFRKVKAEEWTPQLAMEELLKGPTPEERKRGFWSWFGPETAGMLNRVTVTESGLVIVDFKDFSEVIPNASTTAGSGQLMRELGMTLAQFEEITEIEYRFDGDCQAFSEWLPHGECQVVPASQYR
ncbi:MAG: GerMN domain-containing protein [Firmicutes bacterium]|nr:GerMN domain-containing protein [Bacillota bacterium]